MSTGNKKNTKILLVFQENFLAKAPNCDIDFISTGESFTPMAVPVRNQLKDILQISWNIIARKYDIIFVPTPNLIYPWDRSWIKKTLRNTVRLLMKSGLFASVVRFMTRHAQVVVLDRYAVSTVQLDFWKIFGPTSDYYTTNLSVENDILYNHRADKPPVGNVYQFPLYIFTSKYHPPKGVEKDIELFFSGTINSKAREEALPALELLKQKGYNVLINTSRLSMEQYLDYMSRSLLCLSPAGVGYDCFRHYEIMLCSSVPIINASDEPLKIALSHGENCFLYKDADDMVRQVESLLKDPQSLKKMGEQLSTTVHATNDIYSVGNKILSRYITDSSFKQKLSPADRVLV
jgi:glycosyltransferase involved in cell wall biosynthesis